MIARKENVLNNVLLTDMCKYKGEWQNEVLESFFISDEELNGKTYIYIYIYVVCNMYMHSAVYM